MRLRALFACFLGCALLWAWSPLPTLGQSLNGVQGKIDATRGKIGRKKGTEHVLSSDIARWTHRIDALQGRISSLQRRETVLSADLDGKRAELELTQKQLRAERARLVRLRARLRVGRELLARRLVELYRSDPPDLVTVVLRANGFAELLEQREFLRRISASDRNIVRVVQDAKAGAAASFAWISRCSETSAVRCPSRLTRSERTWVSACCLPARVWA